MKTKNLVIIGASVIIAGVATFFGVKKFRNKKAQDNNQGAGE